MSINKHFYRFTALALSCVLLLGAAPAEEESGRKITVSRGDITDTATEKVALSHPVNTVVRYEGSSAVFVSANKKYDDTVEAGEVLLTITSGIDPVYVSEKERELSRLETEYNDQVRLRTAEINIQRSRLSAEEDPLERQKKQLDLDYALLELAYYKESTEQQLETLRTALAALHTEAETTEIVAPVSGRISEMTVRAEGDVLSHGDIVCRIEDSSVTVVRSPSSRFAFGKKVSLIGKRAGQELALDAVIISSSSLEMTETESFISVISQENDQIRLDTFDSFSLKGETVSLQNVLILPTRNIKTDSRGDFVYILDDAGNRIKQYIMVKYINSDFTWVIRGLSEGQQVFTE